MIKVTQFIQKPLKVLTMISVMAVSIFLLSCEDDEAPFESVSSYKELGRYEFAIRSTQESLQIELYGIDKTVMRIESPLSWLDISGNGKTEQGSTLLSIKRTGHTPEHFECDSAYVYFSDLERAMLVVSADEQIKPLGDNAGEYAAFNKAWWEQEEILYSTTRTVNGSLETTAQHIPLPWAPASTSNIPTRVFESDGLTANVGWVMAYNLFAAQTNGNPNSKPYFMLYNKYTGVLRVFYYQFEDIGTGGEVSFVITPDAASSPKYPYYHNLQYAIPVCNRDVPLKGNVLNIIKGNSSFQQQVTPYVKSDVSLKAGWYCFDLDWSAYNPSNASPFKATDRMSVDCKTANNTSITMAGTITGKSEGTIEGLSNSSTSTANGMNYLDQFKSGTDNATDALDAFMKGDYLKAAFKGVMSLWNFGKSLTGNATDDYTTETKSTGTINQSFTGEISLDGYSTSNTSNNAINVEFSYNSFAENENVGQGVWSLQDNPIVYVVNDRLMGEDEDLACFINEDSYSFGATDPALNNLRLMTFFDPTSIKINLNTSLFKDVRNVEMSWIYGVYPNQPHGHTDIYRNALLDFKSKGMLAEPEFIDKKKNKGNYYMSYSSDFANMTYLEAPLENVVTTKVDNNTKVAVYNQKNANYRYYGQPGNNLKTTDNDFFIVDPVVLLPTTFTKDNETDENGAGRLYDFIAPDYVVGVMLSFEYTLQDGTSAKAFLSKRFLPQVKSITTSDMLKMRDKLQKYCDQKTHQTVGNLVISHKGAKEMLSQFFSTSEFLKKNQ